MAGAAGRASPRPGWRGSSASRNPHAEHVFVLGYQRPVTTRRRPARSHLYSSWRRNSPHPQSEMARARRRLRTMFVDREVLDRDQVVAADQLGGGAVQEVRAGRCGPCGGPGLPWPSPWPGWPSPLAAGQPPLVAGEVAGLALQVPGVGDPLAVRCHGEAGHAKVDAARRARSRAKARGRRRQRRRSRTSGRRARARRSPWPGRAPVTSTSGHDHANASGPVVLARRSSPSRMENADRV